jgi:protein-S-isoprenylcysteine O-methyltransferase Ste14
MSFHTALVWTEIGLAAVTFVVLMFLSAPYGRHARPGWGPTISARLSWILMELPCVTLFVWVYLRGEHRFELVPLALLVLWQAHYLHRTFIYPARIRIRGKRTPVLIVVLAFIFQSMNSWINAFWLSHAGDYAGDWIRDPRFIIGVSMFVGGFLINFQSDEILRGLRKPGERGYKVPHGGLYRWVSAPNYFGEILEWFGWALATWSTAGLAFALYTMANLLPRALDNHKWYLERFPDYPRERKALLPHIL